MNLRNLINGIQNVSVHGDADIVSLACDSRSASAGTLFAALPGAKFDGKHFIPEAIARGASAVLSDVFVDSVPCILTSTPRKTFAEIADKFYNSPSKSIRLIGVTGTNGKTTTAYLLRHIFNMSKERCGMLGTIEYDLGSSKITAPLTTPECVDFTASLAEMKKNGCTTAAVEVSSHALDQYRVHPHRFSCAVFTNLTRDHLDYHKTMESYFNAKKRLFDSLDSNGYACVNADDKYGDAIVKDCAGKVIRYGLSENANVHAAINKADLHGTTLTVRYGYDSQMFHSPLVGDYNVSNVLGACAASVCLGLDLRTIAYAVESFPGVPGRLERFHANGITVFVDYAHTDDAIRSALSVLKQLTCGKLWVVFGCGGDRDRGKRPMMARAAEQSADYIVVTQDNPRTEYPGQILKDIESGFSDLSNVKMISDRSEAISYTIKNAQVNDVILVAGKGHENYQIFGTVKHPFDDCEQVKTALEKK